MDDKTIQALTTLATKLGTTAEYLFGVLVKQAPITGITDLVLLLLVLFSFGAWARFVYVKTNHPDGWGDEGEDFGWVSVVLYAIIVIITLLIQVPEIMASLLNPEYWALAQLLK